MASRRAYKREARRAARRYGVDPDIFQRQIGAESGWNPNAQSPAGAQGIAQFMPGTARAYGVRLGDGRASDDLDGAARYMRDLLKQFDGDYRLALAGYNAGGGNARRALTGFPETRNYVAKILGGSSPKRARRSEPRRSTSRAETTSVTTPGVDRSQERQSLKYQYLQERGRPGALLALKQGLDSAQDVPERTETTTRRVRRRQEPRTSRRQGRGLRLHEMFYDPGINVKNGRRTNAIGGHRHLHVAAPRDQILEIAREAQERGLTVRELEPFDPVDPVHTDTSWHYRKRAADISGDPRELARFNRELARRAGVR